MTKLSSNRDIEKAVAKIHTAIAKLTSLHDGDAGVIETIACGEAAIPALRTILFSRERSGLYETRRRAVEALDSLHAFAVLREFLGAPHDIKDPVELTGEEAVINAAARALGKTADKRDIPLLVSLIGSRSLSGVIEALGKFQRTNLLPYFIHALEDDFSRTVAEEAIRKLGARARIALIETALERHPDTGREAGFSINRRRSALKLLQSRNLKHSVLPISIISLMHDQDPWIALWAGRLCITSCGGEEKKVAIARLMTLLKSADHLLAAEIEDILVEQYRLVCRTVETALAQPPTPLLHQYGVRRIVCARFSSA